MSDVNVSYRVLENELLLNNILSFLDVHSLRRAQSVAKQWRDVSTQVIKRRQNIVQVLQACGTKRDGKPNSRLSNLKPSWEVISEELEQKIKDHLWYEFKFGLLFHGPCSPRNFKAGKPSEALRKNLPKSSEFVHVISRSGIIGWCNDDSRTAVEIQCDVTNSAGISYLLFSDVAMDIDVFVEGDPIDKLLPGNGDKHLKGIILLTRTLYQSNEIKSFPVIDKLHEAYNGKLAVGGLVVQHINHLRGNEKSTQDSLKWIGIALSGENLKMASCILEAQNSDDLRLEMENFKSSLDFPVNGRSIKSKTVGILLACNGRGKHLLGEANNEVDIFASVFPGVRLTGSYGDGEFGLDYWPKGGSPERSPEDYVEGSKWWHFYSSVLLLIHVPIRVV